jgi:hypothetical protein
MNNISLKEIVYPVFEIKGRVRPEVDPTTEQVYTFIERKVDDVLKPILSIIDDPTIEQPTIGRRRLILEHSGIRLHPLSSAIFFLADIIKVATPHTFFIDNNGKLFKYKKSLSAKLTFNEINKIFPISSGGAIIEIKDSKTRFKTLTNPDSTIRYAGILNIGMAQMLYGLYSEKHKDSWRLV